MRPTTCPRARSTCANPLLRRPLDREDIKPRLLGHWGTSPGLNLCYAHLNRVIAAHDLDMIYVFGPGHGGPAADISAPGAAVRTLEIAAAVRATLRS